MDDNSFVTEAMAQFYKVGEHAECFECNITISKKFGMSNCPDCGMAFEAASTHWEAKIVEEVQKEKDAIAAAKKSTPESSSNLPKWDKRQWEKKKNVGVTKAVYDVFLNYVEKFEGDDDWDVDVLGEDTEDAIYEFAPKYQAFKGNKTALLDLLIRKADDPDAILQNIIAFMKDGTLPAH